MAALLISAFLPPKLHTLPFPSLPLSLPALPIKHHFRSFHFRSRLDFRVHTDSDSTSVDMADDYYNELPDEEAAEIETEEMVDDEVDFELQYDRDREGEGEVEIGVGERKGFVDTQGWDAETVVGYRINEDQFHKMRLLDCDFFIRKGPDDDAYDFREMYVTPPDTDVYAIPKVLAPMPDKYIRCAMSEYGGYNQTEPPIEALRDPLYKTEREIFKVFLTKHYKNHRLSDPDFVLDFEEIYVIDSKSKSITRAKVLVTAPGGRNRDRRNDLLVIHDYGSSFKIIDRSEKEDPGTVIEKIEWVKSRQDMERHLRKLRDFHISNWF
ncbi:PLASTID TRANSCRIPTIONALLY ACTIVE protein 6, chloroplastic-like protein [Drosera capensis]